MQQNSKLMKPKLFFASLFICTSLLAGCAGTFAPATAESTVGKRAQQRVDLLLKSKFDEAYEYLPPSYRALNNTESYRSKFGAGAKWVKPNVTKVECAAADRCIATVQLGVLVVARGFGTKPIDSTIFETWIKEDGQWWYFQRD